MRALAEALAMFDPEVAVGPARQRVKGAAAGAPGAVVPVAAAAPPPPLQLPHLDPAARATVTRALLWFSRVQEQAFVVCSNVFSVTAEGRFSLKQNLRVYINMLRERIQRSVRGFLCIFV